MTFSTFGFAAPWMLLFLLPAGFAAWRLLRRARRSGIRFSATRSTETVRLHTHVRPI